MNQTARLVRYGGRALRIGAVGAEAYNIATAPPGERQQVAAEAAGRLTGGPGGACAGAQLGAIGGPWGAAGGALIGGALGAAGGEELIDYIFGFE